MTFIELCDEVMAQRAEEGIRGISRERSRYRCHVTTAHFAGWPIETIKTVHIVEWVRDMQRKETAGGPPGGTSVGVQDVRW